MGLAVDKSTWKTKTIRVYDPWPTPNQPIGCCTGVAKSSQFNAIGNRVKGEILNMDDAIKIYSTATTLDPWSGSYPPDDTGSSGLASAKAAIQHGLGAEYRWLFGGADEVVQAIMANEVISVGTWWYWDMFEEDSKGIVHPGGGLAGGHQWIVRGYNKPRDLIKGRCWWGHELRDFWISRTDLDALLKDDGDAHWQKRAGV
jgi:hypothetical protein